MRFFLNLIYASSVFQRTRLELQRNKTATLARGSVSESDIFSKLTISKKIENVGDSDTKSVPVSAVLRVRS